MIVEYTDGEPVQVGDRVRIQRRFRRPLEGTVVQVYDAERPSPPKGNNEPGFAVETDDGRGWWFSSSGPRQVELVRRRSLAEKAAGSVQSGLAELARYLEETAARDGPDRLLARSAVGNIRATLAKLDHATEPAGLRDAFQDAWYDIGDKGIFDWAWSAEVELRLREHAESIGQALDRADRWARRHPRAR